MFPGRHGQCWGGGETAGRSMHPWPTPSRRRSPILSTRFIQILLFLLIFSEVVQKTGVYIFVLDTTYMVPTPVPITPIPVTPAVVDEKATTPRATRDADAEASRNAPPEK